MKKTALSLLIALILSQIAPLIAEQQTLISDKEGSKKFRDTIFRIDSVKGKRVYILGGADTWLGNENFAFGQETQLMLPMVKSSDINAGSPGELFLATYGLRAALTIAPERLLHPMIYIVGGFGVVGYNNLLLDLHEQSWITFIEPGIGLDLNMTEKFRTGLRLSYRFVSGIDSTPGLKNEDLSGATAALVFSTLVEPWNMMWDRKESKKEGK